MATRRIQLTHFAIPLGLCGLGGAYLAAETELNAPSWPTEVLFVAALVFWLVFTALYLLERIREPAVFRVDREHPATGPNAALIPVIGILLAAHWSGLLGPAAPWVIGFFVAALGAVAAQLLVF